MLSTISDEQLVLIAEQRNVRLMELDEAMYYISYINHTGQRVRSPLMCYQEAENNFVRRVEEEDYR